MAISQTPGSVHVGDHPRLCSMASRANNGFKSPDSVRMSRHSSTRRSINVHFRSPKGFFTANAQKEEEKQMQLKFPFAQRLTDIPEPSPVVYTQNAQSRNTNRPSTISAAASSPGLEHFYPPFQKYKFICRIGSCIVLLFMFLASSYPPPYHRRQPYEQIHLRLALQWPTTLCLVQPCHKVPFAADNFTIHGLWPHNGQSPIVKCHYEWRLHLIAHLIDQLNLVWPSYTRFNNDDFWKREWWIHGSCSIFSQPDYFQKAIDLTDHYQPHLVDMAVDSFAYLPSNFDHSVECSSSATLVVFERSKCWCVYLIRGWAYRANQGEPFRS